MFFLRRCQSAAAWEERGFAWEVFPLDAAKDGLLFLARGQRLVRARGHTTAASSIKKSMRR
jgi:hypothetical protein